MTSDRLRSFLWIVSFGAMIVVAQFLFRRMA